MCILNEYILLQNACVLRSLLVLRHRWPFVCFEIISIFSCSIYCVDCSCSGLIRYLLYRGYFLSDSLYFLRQLIKANHCCCAEPLLPEALVYLREIESLRTDLIVRRACTLEVKWLARYIWERLVCFAVGFLRLMVRAERHEKKN